MKFMKLLFLAAFVFLASQSFAQSLTNELLKQPYSLLATVFDPNSFARMTVKPDCLEALRKHIESGGDLRSEEILKRSLPIEKFPREDVSDRDFYHYTHNVEALDIIAGQKSFHRIFQHLRKRFMMVDWMFYVAGDPDSSSKDYGPYSYKFIFKPGTLIFFSHGDLPGASFTNVDIVNELVKNELSARNPELASCSYSQEGRTNFLTYMAAESSGVGAIAYYGLNNRFGHGNGYQSQWLQVLTPNIIESMVRVK